ncbi:MAG: transglycosylase domain-containing protein, partial [Marinilabiliales bacterium]|nr:transglycosylase domain-containing protein [Marinilabiliales bacterium]
VRGGSTITMQVARLARGNPDRTYAGKIIEMFSALKLELFRSKKAILTMYARQRPIRRQHRGSGSCCLEI